MKPSDREGVHDQSMLVAGVHKYSSTWKVYVLWIVELLSNEENTWFWDKDGIRQEVFPPVSVVHNYLQSHQCSHGGS